MEKMYDKNYSLPTEITTETKVFRNINVTTIVILLIFLYIGTNTREMVYLPLQVPYLIFHMLVGLLLCIKTSINEQKKLYQSFLIMLSRDKKYYKPIKDDKQLPNTIQKFKNYDNAITFIDVFDENV